MSVALPSVAAHRDYDRACERLARLVADLESDKRAEVFDTIAIFGCRNSDPAGARRSR